jgi:hypothetical protein
MNNMYPGNDLEGDARESADLKVGLKMPEIKRHAMPQFTDGELYLRLNCPDGLKNNQQQPTKWQPEDTSTPGSIRHDRE